jgi:apolipoprotein N-acyltransferase
MRWAAFFAGGVPAILVFPGPSLSYLAWFALVPAMVLFIRAETVREAVARGWWFGAAYLIAILQWMTPEIGPGVVLIGGVFGCMWSPFAVAAHRLLRPPLRYPRVLAALIVVPATWLVPEWIRSYQGLGGPWGLYGASQWQHPAVLALAAVGGVWLVSVALLISNTGLVLLLGAIRPALLLPGVPTGNTAGRRIAIAAAGLAAFAAAAGAGPLAFALTPPFPVTRQVAIALVQPGIIHDPAQRVDASERLTRQYIESAARSGQHADLIVWGESSVAFDLALDTPLLRQIEALSAQARADIMVSQDSTIPGPGGGQAKVAVLVSPAGIADRYIKTRLVPFGEYIPLRQQLGWLTKVSRAASSNMVPGSGARTLTVQVPPGSSAGPIAAGILVCFESAFPDMSRVETGQGAQFIVYQSATSTFQGTWGPEQHASLAAIRAAETGRPVVQAALTGDSVAFDARGRQLARLGQDSDAVITVGLSLPDTAYRTLYDQAGDYVMWSGVGITVLAALVMLLGRRHFLGKTPGAPHAPTAEYDADTGAPVR